ncbi:MAG: response regulator [Bacteroidota bacterium]
MKILIVDDEKDIQRLFEQRFRKERRSGLVELHFCFSAQEALTYLQKEDAKDLTMILSDINMPKMSGLELLKAVRQQYPELQVYIITAYDDQEKRQQAMELGATDFITKPISFSLLKDKILPQ